MKKIILLLLFCLIIPCFADDLANQEPIQLTIKYNETTARIEAFKKVDYKIDKTLFSDFLKDKNRKENLLKMNDNIFELENRYLCPFSAQGTIISYAITYKDNILNTYYYNILGSLVKVDIKDTKDSYPQKTYSYSRYGNLIGVVFEVDKDEQFVYEANGKLIAHWIGSQMYDKENKTPKFLKIQRGEINKKN